MNVRIRIKRLFPAFAITIVIFSMFGAVFSADIPNADEVIAIA